MESTPKSFNLLRCFSILSLLCISLISSASAFLLSRFLTQKMLERDAVITMQFVQSTVASIDPGVYFADSAAQKSQATYDNFFAGPNWQQVKTAFEDFFKRLVLMPEVVRANVYALDGTIIWSSHPNLVGHRFGDNPELQQALAGRLAVKTETVEHPKKAEHVFFTENLQYFVESYIPIKDSQRQSILGVVEVYKVPDAVFKAIAKGKWLVWGSAWLGGCVLY